MSNSTWKSLSQWSRERFEGSFAQDLLRSLATADFGNRIVLFGAEMLFSVLPMIILLSALASHRVDVDISRHLGLNSQGANIVAGLFRHSVVIFNFGVLLSLLLSLVGTLAVAGSIQDIYEDAFGHAHAHGVSNYLRCGVWVAVAVGLLVAEAAVSRTFRNGTVGPIVLFMLEIIGLTLFFLWSMHFLLARRGPWRHVLPAALTTALFCIGLGVVGTFYFSSTIVSDSRQYGTIGVVFTLLTWFIAIGAVIILGASFGAVWIKRRHSVPQTQNPIA